MHAGACSSESLCRSAMRPTCRSKIINEAAAASAAARAAAGLRVAVVGAGAAGLVAARELRDEGLEVVVFEQSSAIGGTWVYTDEVEDDLLHGSQVHASMYAGVRTNLPRELMGFTDLPFVPEVMGRHSVDPRRYCGVAEVLGYLNTFCEHFQLDDLIRFNRRVVRITATRKLGVMRQEQQQEQQEQQEEQLQEQEQERKQVTDHKGSSSYQLPLSPPYLWHVETFNTEPGCHNADTTPEVSEFDAVVVANGHHTVGNVPKIPGMDVFPAGRQLHSHNYRRPQAFSGKVILVVGASYSGQDISQEVASEASMVILSARTWAPNIHTGQAAAPLGERKNIYRYPMVKALHRDGTASFLNGERLAINDVIYCTGYQYTFPFLLSPPHGSTALETVQPQGNTLVDINAMLSTSKDRQVGPLFLHLFPPKLAPWLSFLGLPWVTVPNIQLEMQSKLVSRALSGRTALGSMDEMQAQVEAFYQQLEEECVPVRYTHLLHLNQWTYNDQLAELSGDDVPKTSGTWREVMYRENSVTKRLKPDTWRDGPYTELYNLALVDAYKEFDEVISSMRNRASS